MMRSTAFFTWSGCPFTVGLYDGMSTESGQTNGNSFAGDVLRDVDEDRTRTTAPRDVEGFLDRRGEVLHVLDEVVVLGARPRDADDVRFLERVVADEVRRDLAGDGDDGRRVHHRVREAGDEVRRAGAARRHAHADLAGRARVAFRGVRRALLVPHEDVRDAILRTDEARRTRGGSRRRGSRT